MKISMLSKYLKKIGMSENIELDIHSLKQLHKLHHSRIPFENFDVLDGKPIILSKEALYNKMVLKDRGGYCFELNGLLLNVLTSLGFDARALLGRVHLSEKPSGRGHLVCLVTLNNKPWIVDTGFGSQTPREPLPLELDRELVTDNQTFRFIKNEYYGVILQQKNENKWFDLYSLDMSYVCDGDINYGNYFTSTNPSSIFTFNCVASLRTEDGIIALLNNKLKIKSKNGTKELTLDNEIAYFSALKEHFGLTVDIAYSKINNYF